MRLRQQLLIMIAPDEGPEDLDAVHDVLRHRRVLHGVALEQRRARARLTTQHDHELRQSVQLAEAPSDPY